MRSLAAYQSAAVPSPIRLDETPVTAETARAAAMALRTEDAQAAVLSARRRSVPGPRRAVTVAASSRQAVAAAEFQVPAPRFLPCRGSAGMVGELAGSFWMRIEEAFSSDPRVRLADVARWQRHTAGAGRQPGRPPLPWVGLGLP